MGARPRGVRPVLPDGVGTWAVIAFYSDYGAGHPLWLATGIADLVELRLPTDLVARLERWSYYWESHYRWDVDWTEVHPDRWWLDEGVQLPRDVATALGGEFAVAVDGGYVYSGAPPSVPEAARAMRIYIAERTRLLEQVAKRRSKRRGRR